MAKAVIARIQGDDYQARFFWLQGCRLFDDHSKVVRVTYEAEDVAGFDDVGVHYQPAILDEYGDPVSADLFQLKFHVDYSGSFTAEALTDPAFIGSQSSSLLKRLQRAQSLLPLNGTGTRFFVVSPWQIHPDDLLAKLVDTNGGRIRLNVLFDGSGPRSKMGRQRSAWKAHLGIHSDDQLRAVLRPLRIHVSVGDLQFLRSLLNDKLRVSGLLPVEDSNQVHPYDDLIRKLHRAGRTSFSRDEIKAICRRERLWCGRQVAEQSPIRIGVRSFMRWAEYMEDGTDEMLCLLRHFDNRRIREPQLWQHAVLAELTAFLSRTMRDNNPYHLRLDAHASIAFAAGYWLDAKSGINVTPVTGAGRIIWSKTRAPASEPLWTCRERMRVAGKGDIAVAINVTHDTFTDVSCFVEKALPTVGRILSCTAVSTPGPEAVSDGGHAWAMAQQLSAQLKAARSAQEGTGTLHLFAAAPNALLFFLGQLGRGFGPSVFYEYDFERNVRGGYEPSLAFPPKLETTA